MTGRCDIHGIGQYDEKYDVFFCPICDDWLEKKCSDDDCDYCKNRPLKPTKSLM